MVHPVSAGNQQVHEFFTDRTAKVFYDSNTDALFLEFYNRVLNDDHFIVITNAVLAAFKNLNTKRFIVDLRKMGMISVNAQKRFVINLLPQLASHLNGRKLFHAQVIDPKEILSRVCASNIVYRSKEVAPDFQILQFSSVQELQTYMRIIR